MAQRHVKRFYERALRKLKWETTKAKLWFGLALFAALAGPAVLLPIFAVAEGDFDFFREISKDPFLLYSIAAHYAVIVSLLVIVWWEARVLRRGIRRGWFKDVRTEQAPAVFAQVQDVLRALDIKDDRVRVMCSDSTRVSPSLVEQHGKINILLPLGAVVLARQDPGVFRAMLLHEFGHVAHHDTRLWLWTQAIARLIGKVIVPFMVLMGLVNVVILCLALERPPWEWPEAAFGGLIRSIAPYVALWYFLKEAIPYRQDAEKMADAFAALHGSGHDMSRAIKLYADAPHDRRSHHPKKPHRLSSLRRFLTLLEKPADRRAGTAVKT
jgi:hypothetical protein